MTLTSNLSSSLSSTLESVSKNPTVNKLLAPAAFVYGAGSYMRILSFSLGLSPRTKAGAPIVSIGNVTVGGTGKTPIVIDLAERLGALFPSLKLAILSRGYGRRSQVTNLLVSDGGGPVVSVEEAGDEPYVMARSLPAATVIVGSKRIHTSELAVKNHGAGMILLDDGFQHVQLKRDLDIVLFDYNDQIESMNLLPQGRLREPLSALGRADVIVVTKIPVISDSTGGNIKSRLKILSARLRQLSPQAVLQYVSFAPSHLLPHGDESSIKKGDKVPLSTLAGGKVFALCGIARPEGFFASLEGCGANIIERMSFPDHHWFSAADLTTIQNRFERSGADMLVTTEKDLVRLHLSPALSSVTYALMQAPQWLTAEAEPDGAPAVVDLMSKLLP